MESPLIEGHWYKITPLDVNDTHEYVGKLIKSNVQFNMLYFEGVVEKNGKNGSYSEIGEQNFAMGSYCYTEPTEGEVIDAMYRCEVSLGDLSRSPVTHKSDFLEKRSRHFPIPYAKIGWSRRKERKTYKKRRYLSSLNNIMRKYCNIFSCCNKIHPKDQNELSIILNNPFGCHICKYIVVSHKNRFGHRFCEYCVKTIIIEIDILNNYDNSLKFINQFVEPSFD